MLQEVSRREQIDMDLLRRYRTTGDPWAREELARRCMPLVKAIARKYVGRGEEFDDLVQAGTVGLVKAIERFDLDSGGRFVSYAVPNITGEIRRHFRDHTWAVHVPRSLQELDQQVQITRTQITTATGRDATEDDIATALDVPVSRVREARGVSQAYRALSMDAPVGEAQNLSDTHGALDEGYAQVEAQETIRDAMDVLDGRECDVVQMRYRDELLQREIAGRIGVSQMQVSRILSNAVERMAAHVAVDDPPAIAA